MSTNFRKMLLALVGTLSIGVLSSVSGAAQTPQARAPQAFTSPLRAT